MTAIITKNIDITYIYEIHEKKETRRETIKEKGKRECEIQRGRKGKERREKKRKKRKEKRKEKEENREKKE